MRRHFPAITLVVLLTLVIQACASDPKPGTVQDEAKRAGVPPERLILPTPDYFKGMDDNIVGPDGHHPTFTQAEIEGRNQWIVWTAGNDRLWDQLTVDSLGTFDLLKSISSHPPRPVFLRAQAISSFEAAGLYNGCRSGLLGTFICSSGLPLTPRKEF